jgi:hypothetical protein
MRHRFQAPFRRVLLHLLESRAATARVSRAVDHRELPCQPGRRAVPRLPHCHDHPQQTPWPPAPDRPGGGPFREHVAEWAGARPVLCCSRWVNITELVIFHRPEGSVPPSDTKGHRQKCRCRWTRPPGPPSSGACATSRSSEDYDRNLLRPAGVTPRLLRCTRLASLTASTDPKLVSAAFGIHAQAATHYLASHIDDARLHGTNPDGAGRH